jgi:tetratricopeptide (TPR) repeat protein
MLAHYLLASTYTDMGEAPQALDEFHRAAACADTTSTDCDYSLLARAYGQMAELLYVNELPRNALHAFLQAYHFSGLAQEAKIASYYFSQQGKCYYDLMLPDSAIIIAEKAIQMLYECGDTLAANTLKGSIAYGLIERGEYDKAKEYLYSYEHCSFINEESLKQIENYKLLYIYKGFYYQHIAETDSALYYYHKAYQTSSSPKIEAIITFKLTLNFILIESDICFKLFLQ